MLELEDPATYRPCDAADWLEAVGEFIQRGEGQLLEPRDLLAAYAIVGVATELTDDERYWAGYHLETFGFVRRQVMSQSSLARLLRRKLRVAYQIRIPDRWTDEEIAGAAA